MMPLKLERAVQQVRRGGVIAYPTEAVWGLGCDPLNSKAVGRLLAIKQRPVEKGLILVAASVEQFAPYLEHLSPQLLAKFSQVLPQPVTWLVSVNSFVPSWISGKFSSVAL
jgi:L-threonylcarbamoyladenylate synthase